MSIYADISPLVKCKHCGQWAAVFTACAHCGAPVDPEQRSYIPLEYAGTTDVSYHGSTDAELELPRKNNNRFLRYLRR